MKKPANKNNKKPGSNLSKYRNQIIEFSGIEVKQAKKSKKSKLEIIKSKLSRKEKRKLERKLKHAKNLAFRSKTEMPNIDTILINTKKGLKKAKKNDETIETKALKKKKSKASKEIAEKVTKNKIKHLIDHNLKFCCFRNLKKSKANSIFNVMMLKFRS